MAETVAVIGGQGFLGQHVTDRLRAAGMNPVSVSRRTGVDLLDAAAIEGSLAQIKPAAVVNCAAHGGSIVYVSEFAADVIHDNALMTLNLYKAVQRAVPGAVIVNPIANCSYPGAANIHSEADWQNGPVHDSVLPFAASRRFIHAVADSYARQHKIRSVNFLVANAYGPGDHVDVDRVHALNGIIIRLIKAQQAGAEEFEIWGTGTPLREWVYIEDAARVLVDAVLSVRDSRIYPVNIGQKKAFSILEIAQRAAETLGYPVRFRTNTKYPDGAPIKMLDDERFRQLYPDFHFTPIDEGIRNTVAYYRPLLA